jgi:hypothetical protein
MVGINRFRRFRLFETVFFCYDRCTPFAKLSTYGVSRSVWKPSCDKMETDEMRDGKSDRASGIKAQSGDRRIEW